MLKHYRRTFTALLTIFALSAICASWSLSAPPDGKGKPPKDDGGGGDAISYTITDLGRDNLPRDMNNAGQVVGRDWQNGPRALLWKVDAAGNIQEKIYLGTLPGFTHSAATAISELGEVVGFLQTFGSEARAFYLQPSDVDGDGLLDWYADADGVGVNDLMIDLGTLLDGDHSFAIAINERRQILGQSNKAPGGPTFPVLWQVDADGKFVIKEMPVDGSDINNFGLLVGGFGVSQLDADGNVVETHDLGTLLPAEIGFGADATAINDSGEVVGVSCEPASTGGGCLIHGFVVRPLDGDDDGTPDTWFLDENGDGVNDLMVPLGNISNTVTSPNDINESGQVVGSDTKGDRAFLWQNGVMTDLHRLVPRNLEWDVREAMAISDLGQIVGKGWRGKRTNAGPHGWLLTPK